MTSPFVNRNRPGVPPRLPTPPTGWPIGSYATYEEARRAADFLALEDFLGSCKASAVSEIVNRDGRAVALQVALADGSSLLCTVWTDWSLLLERRADQEVPDYFWPVDDHSIRSIVPDVPAGGLEITSVEVSVDEVGTTMGVEIEFDGHLVSARSFGGELELSVR